jgi:rare lipoprotein A
MRPMRWLRKLRPVHVIAGALMLLTPASAVALTVVRPDAKSAAQVRDAKSVFQIRVQMNVRTRHVTFGHDLIVTGTASAAAAGSKLLLEFLQVGDQHWRTLRTGTLARDGQFRFASPVRESGRVRITVVRSASASTDQTATEAGTRSAPQRVTVGSDLRIHTGSINVLGGTSFKVSGRLVPGVEGRRIELRGRINGTFHTLGSATTNGRGQFTITDASNDLGSQWLRVRFNGDGRNTPSWAVADQLNVFQEAVASWYDDAGGTACGYHAYYGVANKTLPCGTKVTFRLGGRSVTATVDDRGPFIPGRTWDLNQNSAAALGFSGVETIWATR